ncbi:MAG: YgjV family protein [Rhodoferax sp.]
MAPILVNASGLAALAFNVSGLVGRSDRSLRRSNGWASALWAANNLLIGADSAAALNAMSVGRQASASVVLDKNDDRTKMLTCMAFLAVTLALSILTWNGTVTLVTTAGSMLSTYAMFYMRGVFLRVAMIGVAALWMFNALAYDSWWQMIANALNGGAAAYGAWRSTQAIAESVSP